MYEIGNISMPKLVRRHMKVQAIDCFSIIYGCFPKDRLHRMLNLLTVYIPYISTLFCGSCHNILP